MRITIRLFFEKRDRSKYISHLDITRCFSRAITRAGIPVWYTEGFNPRIYMTFALPIPLGFESLCESMDMQLVQEDYPLEQVQERLNATLPAGITITGVVPAQEKPDTIALADYTITAATRSPQALLEAFTAFAARESIPVIKRTKKGEREIDLKPLFTVLSATDQRDGVALLLRLAAGTSLNVSPSLLLEAFEKDFDCTGLHWQILRTAILREDATKWGGVQDREAL